MKTAGKIVIATALLAGVLAGCKEEAPPPLVVPKAATVKSFTVSASEVKKDESVTLSYSVENATEVAIRTLGGEAVELADKTAQTGEVQVKVAQDTVYVLTAWGEGGKDSAAASVVVKQETSPLLFAAIPPEIDAGETSALVWNAPGASSVKISANGTELSTSDKTSGSLEVTPGMDTTYTVDAGDGRTAQATVKVRPAIIAFGADVKAADTGAPVNLTWHVGGASKVTLTSDDRGTLAEFTEAAQITDGSFQDTVPADLPDNGILHYVLHAEQAGQTLTRDVTVYVGAEPKIISFKVPPYTKADTVYQVSWQTALADHLEISVGNEVIYSATSQAQVDQGALTLKSPSQDITVKIHAWNVRGGDTVQESIVDPVGLPTVNSFSASPTGITNGGDPITLSWDIPNARHLMIRAKGEYLAAEVKGMDAASGSIDVYPNKDTTYEVIADNTLGDSASPAEAQVTVTTPAELVFNPPSAPAGAPIQVVGSTVAGGGDILGLPLVDVNPPDEGFVDIASTGEDLQMTYADSSIYQVSLPTVFNTMVYGTPVSSDSLMVSPNGWFVFGSNAGNGPDYVTTPLPSSALEPLAIAPYWDDIYVSNGHVYAQVDGTGDQQRLIVQWDNVIHDLHYPSRLTFQAQVYATGKIVFAYKDLSQVPTANPSVGVVNSNEADAVRPPSNPVTGDVFRFFRRATLPQTIGAPSAEFTVRQLIGTNSFIQITSNYPSIKPGDFEISEVNTNPTVADGQWIELHNKTANTIDLNGWTLSIGNSDVTVGQSVLLQPNGYAILAQQPGAGDGLSVDYVWGTSQAMSTSQTVRVKYGNLTFASFAIPSSAPAAGYSQQQDVPAGMTFASGVSGLQCSPNSSYTYGTNGQYGTPGAANPPCTLIRYNGSIPGNFESISTTGTKVSFYSTDEDYSSITLPVPVMVDGTSYSTVWVSTNGFLKLGSSPNGSYYDNKSAPSTSSPKGTLAPFWDDLDANSNGGVWWERKVPGLQPNDGYTIVSYEHVRRYATSGDDLNFQVKFFDDGRVEYHYGTLTGTNGNTATVWWEHVSGKGAWEISINGSPGLTANSAYQFTAQ